MAVTEDSGDGCCFDGGRGGEGGRGGGGGGSGRLGGQSIGGGGRAVGESVVLKLEGVVAELVLGGVPIVAAQVSVCVRRAEGGRGVEANKAGW